MVNCNELKGRIRAYQFALYDLELYMDSHPCDMKAQKLRAHYREKLNRLVDAYEQHYGKLIMTTNDVEGSWNEWISDPWPWDVRKGAN